MKSLLKNVNNVREMVENIASVKKIFCLTD
jgi:hypothetical protein